jgi:hypothetical protein
MVKRQAAVIEMWRPFFVDSREKSGVSALCFTVAPYFQSINHVVAFRRPVAFDRFWQHLIKVDGTFA